MKTRKGIDVSKYNDPSIIEKLKPDFVIIRGGYGKGHLDRNFCAHVAMCSKLNIPYGVYWFSYATSITDAINEANHCIDMIFRAYNTMENCKLPEYPIFFDWEGDSERYYNKMNSQPFSNFMYNEFVEAFCSTVEYYGFWAGVYCDKSHFCKLNTQRFTVWLADWTNTTKFEYSSPVLMQQTGAEEHDGKLVDVNITTIDFPAAVHKKGLNHWKRRRK